MTSDLIAPKGKFRVIGFAVFDCGHWIDGDYDTEHEAVAAAKVIVRRVDQYAYIYTDTGKRLRFTLDRLTSQERAFVMKNMGVLTNQEIFKHIQEQRDLK